MSGAVTGRELLVRAVSRAREGIIIADARQPGFPLIFANESFARLTGYSPDQALSNNLHILHGADIGQPEIAELHAAMASGESCDVTLRNYRKDGSMFWGRLVISTMHDEHGTLTHFFGILKELAERGQSAPPVDADANRDALVGISNRLHFDERHAELLQVAQRIHSALSVLMIDLDHFKLFNERYGRAAGNECLRMVGACIAKSFIRNSDCVARYGGEEFAVVCFSAGIDALRTHTQRLCEKVRALGIPHGDSPHGVVTISIGGVHRLPDRATNTELLIALAEQELLAAKHSGRDRVHIIN